MTEQQLLQALRFGLELGQSTSAEAMAFGEMGFANTSSAALVAHKLCGLSLVDLCGPGTGLDANGIASKLRTLSRAAGRTPGRLSASEALRQYGGFEMVMMMGAMLGAAARARILLVDGYIATSAALAAVALAPADREFLVFGHRSGERGHDLMLKSLQAVPLLDS